MHVMRECGVHSHLVQSQGCEALFNCVFRCEDAGNQAQDLGLMGLAEEALHMDLRDATLQKHGTNLRTALQPDGWKGRKLVEDLKLAEASYNRTHHAEKKSQWKDEKTGVVIYRDNDVDKDKAAEDAQNAGQKKKKVHF